MKNILIFDYNNLLFKSLFIHNPDDPKKKLMDSKGRYIGGLYGFLSQISKHINKYNPNFVYVCNDSPPYKRREIFSEYKQDRKKHKTSWLESLKESRIYIQQLLQLLNIPLLAEQGTEADDLIAIICSTESFADYTKIIISNDNDLYQLLSSSVIIEKDLRTYTKDSFFHSYGIEVEDWVKVLALSGTHNYVPGIKGIGIKTALKIVKEKKYEDMKIQHKELQIYESLIKLPFEKIEVKFPNFEFSNKRKILSFLNTFDIEANTKVLSCLDILNRRI